MRNNVQDISVGMEARKAITISVRYGKGEGGCKRQITRGVRPKRKYARGRDSNAPGAKSELKRQAQLDLARRKCRRRLPKLRAAHITDGVVQVHAVKKIERFRPKLNIQPFPDFRILEQSEVDILKGRSTKNISSQVAILPNR
ncbi:MAG: hypothetical protein WA734_20720, partial [Candidatus Acidiferrales bacterium]